MKKRYILFLVVQLIWSVIVCVLTFISGRNSADKAPESFFTLGAVVIGTILFIALQPLLMRYKTSSKACVILVVGYILVFTASFELFKDIFNLFSICCLILSIAGMLTYAVTDEGLSAHLSNKIAAKAVFFLLLILSLVCNVGGNISLICSPESAVHDKIMNIIMLLIIIATSIILFFLKNQSAGMIHLCALVISGLSLESPLMYIFLLLIVAEFLTVTGKFSIYTSNWLFQHNEDKLHNAELLKNIEFLPKATAFTFLHLW